MSMQVAVIDRSGLILMVNRAWAQFGRENGVAPTETAGPGADYLRVCQPESTFGAEGAQLALHGIRAVLEGKQDEFRLEYPCHSPTEQRWFLMSVTPLNDAKAAAVVSHLNITARRLAEERMRHLAHHDDLTGLANRRMFEEIGRKWLAGFRRNDHPMSLVYIDIDRFKAINDTFGHEAGDQVLIEVAARLLSSVRESDVACRLGGDEFAILLHGGESEAESLVSRLQHALGRPLVHESQRFEFSASIGVATTNAAFDTLESLLRRADEAMYRRKRDRLSA